MEAGAIRSVEDPPFAAGPARDYCRWDVDEDAFLALTYPSVSVEEIATKLGRSTRSVYSRARALSCFRPVKGIPRKPWRPEEDGLLRTEYGRLRPGEIAIRLGRSRGSVHHRAEELGLWARMKTGEYLKRQSLARTARPFTGIPDPALAGWVAGIIDGEGSIGLPPCPQISVTSTSKDLVDRLLEIAGGSVSGPYQYQKTKVFGDKVCEVKPQYHWLMTAKYSAFLFLKRIVPFLVVKGERADTAIAFFETHYGWRENETHAAPRY